MRNKIFTRIIITTLLCAFLTLNVGKVTRVSAVGTTAAAAATAFILTGAVYLSYVALTQGEIVLPAADELHGWLGSIGRKVAQYPSGADTYQELYQRIAREPATGLLDDTWTWTKEKLFSFANDFSDTRLISEILKYQMLADPLEPTNGYQYAYPLLDIPAIDTSGTPIDASWLYTGPKLLYGSFSDHYYLTSTVEGTYRNLKLTNGFYVVQQLVNDVWTTIHNIPAGGREPNNGRYLNVYNTGNGYCYNVSWSGPSTIQYGEEVYPLLPFEVIHDEATDTDLPMVIPQSRTQLPSWTDPDNENRPIIPWLPIPDIPTGVPVPPEYTAPPQWGFPLNDLIDLLEELARALINIDAISRLINEFAGQHGDNYYLEYNDGDTNYYTYYQPTIYDNDTEYVTYNINVEEQQDIIPVDLNTVSLYTQNRYLDSIKRSAMAGSSILRDLVVFWYDVEPEVAYIALGSCLAILLGAFIGKWGHS